MPPLTFLQALAAGAFLVTASLASASTPAPPPTPRGDHVDTYHGVVVPDPYRWLEDLESDATRAWVDAQNAHAAAWFAPLEPRVKAIEERLTALLDHPRRSMPTRHGAWRLETRNDGLQDQSPLWRWRDGEPATAQIILDPNTLSEDGTVFLAGTSPRVDGRLLAYLVGRKGSDWREARILDLETGEHLDDHLEWIKFSGLEWAPDGEGFYYGRFPAPAAQAEGRFSERNSGYQLYFHKLGTPQSDDVLVLERPDEPGLGFSASITEDGRWMFLTLWDGTDDRTGLAFCELPTGRLPRADDFQILLEPRVAQFDLLGVEADEVLAITDHEAPRKKIVAAPLVAASGPATWRDVVTQTEDTLVSARLVQDQFVVEYLRRAHSVVRRHDVNGADLGEVELPGLGSVGLGGGERSDTDVYFSFTSYTQPTKQFRLDLATGAVAPHWEASVPGFDPALFETTQIDATSKDGTRVPAFVTRRRDLTGPAPTILYGYGGFNVSLTPGFSTTRLPWLEEGGVLVVANLRGGGEFGTEWHDGGRLANKQNVFDDFVAVAEKLIADGITTPAQLGIQGGSNGGLLTAATSLQRPDLFGAVHAAVGVLDMLRYDQFTIGAFWASDYGLSSDTALFPVLLAYSPLHNVRHNRAYPPTLITTAAQDDRVAPAHSYKFAATLQAAQAGPAPVLLKVETKAGHGGGKPLWLSIRESAEETAFFMETLGMGVMQSPGLEELGG